MLITSNNVSPTRTKRVGNKSSKKAHRVFSRHFLSNLTPVKFQLGINITKAVSRSSMIFFKKTLTLFGPSIKSKLDLSSFVFDSRMTFMAVRFGFYNCFSRESIYFLREARRSILCHLPMSNFRHGSAFGYITSLSKNGQESNN